MYKFIMCLLIPVCGIGSSLAQNLNSGFLKNKGVILAKSAIYKPAPVVYKRTKSRSVLTSVKPQLTETKQSDVYRINPEWVTYQTIQPIGTIPEAQVTKVMIENSKPQIITGYLGTTIIIPPHIFEDFDGNSVVSNIEFTYTSYYTAADIAMAGIPMKSTHGDAENPVFLETGGMFKLEAQANGKPLRIKENASIKMEFVTPYTDPDYKFYALDTCVGNWQLLPTALTPSTTPVNANSQGSVQNAPIDEGVVRVLNSEEYFVHKDKALMFIYYESHMIQKKQRYKNRQLFFKMRKTYVGENLRKGISGSQLFLLNDYTAKTFKKDTLYQRNIMKDYGKRYFALSILEIDVSADEVYVKGTTRQSDTLTFKFTPSSYYKVDADFQGFAYRKLKRIKDSVDVAEGSFTKIRSVWYDSSTVTGKKVPSFVATPISISGLGYYNCDRPERLPSERIIAVNFFVKDEQVHPDVVYLIDDKRNTQFTYYMPQFQNKLGYNPRSNTILYIILGGDYFWFSPLDFKNIPADAKKVNMHLKKIDKQGLEYMIQQMITPVKTSPDLVTSN